MEQKQKAKKTIVLEQGVCKHVILICTFHCKVENEYGNIDAAYGPAAKSYIKWAASMATSLDTGVPWVMCQQADAPDPIVSFLLLDVFIVCYVFYVLLYCPSS